jgi:cobyrinic acid a,c-diamide synthase
MRLRTPRLTIAGLAGDSGKTLITLGLARSLCDRGMAVAAYKKGPDYIDAAWLGAAVRGAGRNLDTFMMHPEAVLGALRPAANCDIAVVEGNRGVFDGLDASGSHSTAALAKLIGSPVVLVVDVTKVTRTASALVLGCKALDPEMPLAGVILNRVATARQEKVIRESMAADAGIPVLGAIPRLGGGDPLPSRHLGLVTAAEHPACDEAIERAAATVAATVDLDRLLAIAATAVPLEVPDPRPQPGGPPVRVAVVRDEAFSFYYPENLEALEAGGAEVVGVSALGDDRLPEAHAVYIGGGFPEVHAEKLTGCRTFLRSLRDAARAGVPVYAECGGLMVLSRQLRVGGQTVPMAGVLDLEVGQFARPKGHGYVVATVDGENPFYPVGTTLRGHEFHYSSVTSGRDRGATAARLAPGEGVGDGRDAIVRRNVWASYVHVHAAGCPEWANGMLAAARGRQLVRDGSAVGWV